MNSSGVSPLDKRILVLPDTAENKVGSIILPPEVTDKESMAMTKGTLVAVGETAFSEAMADALSFGREFDPPKAGDRVMFPKYGGQQFKGTDGEKYRILNDDDLIGRLEE